MTRSELLEVPTGTTGAVHIIYDFCTEAEERFLLEKISAAGGDPLPAEVVAGGAAEAGAGGEGADGELRTEGVAAAVQVAGALNRQGKAWGWKELNGRRSMYWGGTLLPKSGSLIPAPFPSFMDGQWPDVLTRIAETGVYDEWTGGEGSSLGGPNHCLVNEYLPGQGILPHTDGPAYLPCTTTLSLGSHTVLCLRSKPPSLSADSDAPSPSPSSPAEVQKIDLFLPPRSLLVLTGDLYSNWLHGIQPVSVDDVSILRGCANWDGWWSWLGESFQPDEGRMPASEWAEECRRRKGVVEEGEGWERKKRISLTCRRVPKVRKGLFKLG